MSKFQRVVGRPRPAAIILTREQGLEKRLSETLTALSKTTHYANEVVRLAGGVIRENRLLKQPIPRHRALVLYIPTKG